MFCHSVCRLHIYDTLVSLSTDTPRQNSVVIKYYYTIVYFTDKHCIVAINKYKGKFHFIIYFLKTRLCLLCRVPLVPLAVQFYFFSYFWFPTTESYTVSLFTYIAFSRLTNTKVSGKTLMNKMALFVYPIKYCWLNRVLHYIAIWA